MRLMTQRYPIEFFFPNTKYFSPGCIVSLLEAYNAILKVELVYFFRIMLWKTPVDIDICSCTVFDTFNT